MLPMPAFADVAVAVAIRKSFAYAVPEPLRGRAAVGMRVLVPFGRKLLTGFIIGLSDQPPGGEFRLRPIRELLDAAPVIPPSLVETALWIAERYFSPPGEVLKALFPAGTQVSGVRRVRIRPRIAQLLAGGLRPPGLRPAEIEVLETLAAAGSLTEAEVAARSEVADAARCIDALARASLVDVEVEVARPRVDTKEQLAIAALPATAVSPPRLPSAQRRLHEFLLGRNPPLLLKEALEASRCSASVARALESRGLARIYPAPLSRLPLDLSTVPERKLVILTEAQERALAELREMVATGRPQRCLLHGVTGSGKTEIYLRLIADVLRSGGRALLLVPEIGLTPMLSRIAVSHFPAQVALLHSGMSPGERFDQWNRIRSGGAGVVVGTRSAVFAPLDAIRLIVIDEEQDASYKQDESPCYHAREVAWQRMGQSGGLLLMGSATPSVETFHEASTGAMRLLGLPERVEARPLADVQVVDMGREFQEVGKRHVLSRALQAELRERLARGEQSILLLNRRGYSRTLFCRSCGHVYTCPDCSISMTYHQAEGNLVCHYCGGETTVPAACGSCGGPYIYFAGVGTEQLEQVVRTLMPSARVARLDRDTTRRRGALRKTLLDFASGGLDVLVGTQMVAKGHDFPNVTLVGVLAADASLAFPDFRSAERTFQLLTQVAGRAGRGAVPGRVVIQAQYPDHYALKYARQQDYAGYFRHELDFRRLMGYPPFRSLVQFLVANESYMKAFDLAERVARALKDACAGRPGEPLQVLGPAPAPLEKLRGKHRVQVLLKSPGASGHIPILGEAFEALAAHRVAVKDVHVDVDPLSLL